MDEIEYWLQNHRHDCGEISEELRSAISSFVLVWSFFEHTVLGAADRHLLLEAAQMGSVYNRNNHALIEDAAQRGIANITGEPAFQEAFDHFRNRYHDGVNLTDHLNDLVQENGRALSRIGGVFQYEPADHRERIAALLLVAYCLRTNLIHGYKWETGLAGQEGNFTHATRVLMLAVDHPS